MGAPTAAAGHKLPETSALAKAKAVLAKQKALAEKLKKLERPETASETTPAALGGGPSTTTQSDAVRRALEVAKRARAARDAARAGTERRAASASATATAAPAPRALLLNDAGEEVDERGDVLETAGGGGVKAVSAFKVNAKSSEERRKVDKLEAFAALQRETAAEAATADAAWMDPSVIGRRRGRKPEFKVRFAVFVSTPPRSISTKEGGILSKPRDRRSADRSARGLPDATPNVRCGASRSLAPSPNRAAQRRHTRFRFRWSRRKLHSVARMPVSRRNFYACHTKGWALESGRPDGRNPFARATRFLLLLQATRARRRVSRPAPTRGG